MIRDAQVLQPEFVPSDVRHRDGEVNALEAALEPLMRGEAAEIPFLAGPSGSGKTCIAKYLTETLQETRPEFATQYVNCWQAHSAFRALYRILEGIGRALDVHRQSTPRDELIDRIEGYDGPPYVVILDEVDQLDDTHLLYALYHNPAIAMILIATREEALFANLDHRLASRLHSSETIRFRAYSDEALVAILRDRVRWGLDDDVITDDQLATIADAASGDARIAISILRNAARRAQREQADRITEAMLEASIPAARDEVKQRNVETLQPTQRTLYRIVEEHGQLAPGDLYATYEERADPANQVGERQVRRHLNRLADYNLIQIDGSTRDRQYRLAPSAS